MDSEVGRSQVVLIRYEDLLADADRQLQIVADKFNYQLIGASRTRTLFHTQLKDRCRF
jgi:hypothetical protein